MTTTIYIELRSIDMVKKFVDELAPMEGNFELLSGRYVIDAKSIMGIFSLDLSKPLQLRIENANESDIEKIREYCKTS
jgi:phosphocarrier protein HPr